MVDDNEFVKFYDKALKFLSYRPRSEQEIRNRLKLKIKNEKLKITDQNLKLLIDKIVEKLKKYNFVDDLEFARKWIESRLRFKPRSMRFIRLELKHKGISSELIDRLIQNSKFIIQNDLEQARRLIEKRLPRYEGLDKQKIYEKLGRFLASKGFNWDTIKKAIDYVQLHERS